MKPTKEQMDAINQHERGVLTADDVSVFKVVLCDNEIDRDCERFTRQTLKALSELYKGKTGNIDNRIWARVFDTFIESECRETSAGEEYCKLIAWAYIKRNGDTLNTIDEIESGIKKEVSIGCSVDVVACSICGADRNREQCDHKKGEYYNEQLCHNLLMFPSEAFEWAFVAVPASKV